MHTHAHAHTQAHVHTCMNMHPHAHTHRYMDRHINMHAHAHTQGRQVNIEEKIALAMYSSSFHSSLFVIIAVGYRGACQ